MTYLYNFDTAVSSVLSVFIIYYLFRGLYRKYFAILIYLLVEFAVTGLEEWASNSLAGKATGVLYRKLYYTDEFIIDLLLFLMVIVLTYQAIGNNPLRKKLGRILGGIFLAALVLPFTLVHGPVLSSAWGNATSQLLNFAAAIMNMALWAALISSKPRDPQLLTVSAGLGIYVTACAIAWGLRVVLRPVYHWFPNGLISISYVACVVIWFRAFRPVRQPDKPAAGDLVALPDSQLK